MGGRRDGLHGVLTLGDGSPPVMADSPGRFTGLNLDDRLYLGGYRDLSLISAQIGMNRSFDGCISSAVVNGRRLRVENSVKMVRVGYCQVCEANTCKNGDNVILRRLQQFINANAGSTSSGSTVRRS